MLNFSGEYKKRSTQETVYTIVYMVHGSSLFSFSKLHQMKAGRELKGKNIDIICTV